MPRCYPPPGGSGGSPEGPAGGVLSGTYPDPGFSNGMATDAELAAVADAKADVSHSHAQSDVTNLTTDLAAKALASDLTNHLNDAADAHDASAISFSPTGSISSTDVQAAIAEVASEGGFAWTAAVKQASDVTHGSQSFVDTDLVFTFAADSTYAIDLFLVCTSAAATTGYRFAFDTSVAVTTAALTFNHALANTGTRSGGQSIADAAATGLSSGVPTAGALTPVLGSGLLVTSGSTGTCRLVFGPEAAANATFKAGSVLRAHLIT